jgi:hypothetical protein
MAVHDCHDCGKPTWDGAGWHGCYTTPHCDCEIEWLLYIAELLSDEEDDINGDNKIAINAS